MNIEFLTESENTVFNKIMNGEKLSDIAVELDIIPNRVKVLFEKSKRRTHFKLTQCEVVSDFEKEILQDLWRISDYRANKKLIFNLIKKYQDFQKSKEELTEEWSKEIAVLKMKNGDVIALRDDYSTWKYNLDLCRWECVKPLMLLEEIENTKGDK